LCGKRKYRDEENMRNRIEGLLSDMIFRGAYAGKIICVLGICLALLAGCSPEKSILERTETQSQGRDAGKDVSHLRAEDYKGKPYTEINGNEPDFSEKDYTTEAFEDYSALDNLGRCGVAYANICREVMPQEKRGAIGMVKPSGWHTVKYKVVDGKYLYNRCHLIGYQLAGENANEKNLITGTRYLNVEGMLPFEEKVAEYVKETNNHVLYRVTPVYEGDNLVAEGVRMEACSVEDRGEGISFHVFVYNVQPSVEIDYSTGDSVLAGEEPAGKSAEGTEKLEKVEKKSAGKSAEETEKPEKEQAYYIINKNTRRFHRPDCGSVENTLPKNRKSYRGNREALVKQGYEPCSRCKP